MTLIGCARSGTPALSVGVTNNCNLLLKQVGHPSEVEGENALVRIARYQSALDEANRRIAAGASCHTLVVEAYKTAGS